MVSRRALKALLVDHVKLRKAAERAADIFLKRQLYKRNRDGRLMKEEFTRLHFPCYWKYDILFGLKVMAEAGFIEDPRCEDALTLLESKRLPDGGFPAERKLYKAVEKPQRGGSLVDWGGTSRVRSNPFVTADALSVLKAAGRWGTGLGKFSSGPEPGT